MLCTIFLFLFFVINIFFLFTSTSLHFRRVLLSSLLHMYKQFFSSFFIYYILRSHARILLSTIYFLLFSFFCKLCTIFRSTLFINLLSTHIHCCCCCCTRTHKIKSSFSPSLGLPNSAQKLRSCYAISAARFKVPTHTWSRRRRRRGRHRFVSVSLRLHHHPGHYWVIFPPLQSCQLCHFLRWRRRR